LCAFNLGLDGAAGVVSTRVGCDAAGYGRTARGFLNMSTAVLQAVQSLKDGTQMTVEESPPVEELEGERW
jgi:hypothetical protein